MSANQENRDETHVLSTLCHFLDLKDEQEKKLEKFYSLPSNPSTNKENKRNISQSAIKHPHVPCTQLGERLELKKLINPAAFTPPLPSSLLPSLLLPPNFHNPFPSSSLN